jgi:PAS domain-containing protein
VSERAASAERATERQREFDARLSLELGTRNTIEQALAATRQNLLQTETALRDALAQHTTEMTTASNELSEQRSQYTTQLAQASAAHAALEQKLADADQRHASALKAAATQLTEQQQKYETRLAEVTMASEIVSKQLHDTETTLLRIQQESDANAIAFAERLSQRESELAAASATRQLLEGRLVDTETALKHSEAQALAERTASTEQSAQRRAEFDAQLAREVEARNIVERDLAENRAAAEQTRQTLLGQSAALTTEMRELELRLLQDLARERVDYERKLADATKNFERMRQAKEVELQRLGDDHAASQETARQAIAKLENELRAAVTAHRQQVEQLQSGLKAIRQDFEASRAASQRQFEESPIGILRCSDAGVLKEANRALIAALGYRTVDQLRALDSAASVFESSDDFRWLFDHCERTPSESVDCNWKKKDGSRLTLRLRAIRLAADVVDIVAEDVTTLRAVEERLRQAQRMEAVGRLASEVADTCDILLRNVSQDGQQWLATVGSNTAQRHQGELILGDVTRAASFLRQLSVYGEKQTSALAWVDVNTVLRDLAPVLKRVAGDDIELVLPKKVAALNVDVDAERVERVLVNIAAYGRARMPSGGRLIVELARVVVDLDFIAKYPNVRQGAHALISVTEVRTAAPAESAAGIREHADATAIATTPERPGVDLGALQALIGDCGGHLWMKAEPGGNMELKIHLPLRSADTSSAGVLRSVRGRLASTWFQS